jgi:hypothetical protein
MLATMLMSDCITVDGSDGGAVAIVRGLVSGGVMQPGCAAVLR